MQLILQVVQVLDHAYDNQLHSKPLKVLCVVGDDAKFHGLLKLLKLYDYSILTAPKRDRSDVIVQDRSVHVILLYISSRPAFVSEYCVVNDDGSLCCCWIELLASGLGFFL